MRRSPRSFAGRALSYRSVGLTQGKRTAQFDILDGPVSVTFDVDLAFLVHGHEDVEDDLWASLRLAPLILLSFAIPWTLWLNHPRWSFFSYDDLLALGQLGLRWPNQDFLPIELNHVHICRE
jgi:hypothetical protein